jgi:hypothetical protein
LGGAAVLHSCIRHAAHIASACNIARYMLLVAVLCCAVALSSVP